MLDVLASTYMTASRMDQFLGQDFMHRSPHIAQRLRYIHGLDTPDPTLMRQLRGRIGMDGAIERARKPSRIAALGRAALSRIGKILRRSGEWLEDFARPLAPCGAAHE